MAEANRPDGFQRAVARVRRRPARPDVAETLVGQSTAGLDSLLEDIQVTQALAGFRHYLTDAAVTW